MWATRHAIDKPVVPRIRGGASTTRITQASALGRRISDAYVASVRLTALVLASLSAVVCTACAGSGASNGVEVRADEMKFLPSTLRLEAGSHRFRVRNIGEIRHTFSLNAIGEEVTVEPGKTKALSVTLEPGTYRYVCRILDHEGLGMHGTLRVRAD